MTDQPYLLDNAWREGRARLDAVEELLDAGTIALLERRGVGTGWSCLEVGAGGGSIATWLASRVGAAGRVVASDLDTRHLREVARLANVEVRRHDIVAEPLPQAAFDLVHVRLVLEHLRGRDAVVRKLAGALKPGGWLVIESVDYASAIAVSERGAEEHMRSQAARLSAFEASGVDVNYGRRLPRALREAGLVNIGNEGRVFVMEGGSPGARWFELSMRSCASGWSARAGCPTPRSTECLRYLRIPTGRRFRRSSWRVGAGRGRHNPFGSLTRKKRRRQLKRSPKTAHDAIGQADGSVSGHSQAPRLILTAPHASSPGAAMIVRTAAAQRERGRRGRRCKNQTEQRSLESAHGYISR